MEYIEDVYYSLLGELEFPLPEVPNAFAEGAPCEKWYQEMLEAYDHLRHRLGVREEDEDVETIINSFLSIQRVLCREMFHLGVQFQKTSLLG